MTAKFYFKREQSLMPTSSVILD